MNEETNPLAGPGEHPALHIKFDTIHIGIIYVFAIVNPLFLPFGLFYSHLYSIFAFAFIVKWNRNALHFLLILVILASIYSLFVIPFRQVHLIDYFAGLVILFAGLTFSIYVYLYIAFRIGRFHRLMKNLIVLKFAFALIAVLLLLLGLGGELWATHGRYETPRLQMFFYEPSIYALIGAPLVIYAATEFLNRQSWNELLLLILAFVPVALSTSLGVLGSIVLAILLGNFWLIFKSLRRAKSWLLGLLLAFFVLAFANTLIDRSLAVFDGDDLSGTFRVVYSMQAAIDAIKQEGVWLGVGPGQLKYVIADFTFQFQGVGGVDRLANSIASTIATVGVLGLSLKLLIIIGLFFRTHANKFAFSRALFIFVFIYQFTGGYFNNLNEYVLLAVSYGYAQYRQRQNSMEMSTQINLYGKVQ